MGFQDGGVKRVFQVASPDEPTVVADVFPPMTASPDRLTTAAGIIPVSALRRLALEVFRLVASVTQGTK